MSATRTYALADRRSRPHGWPVAVPWVFVVATIGAQIAYPLVDGAELRRVTIASVVLFFLASVSHALVHRGVRWALTLLLVTAGGGLLAEAVGVRSGLPFGHYSYSTSLGAQVLGVPVVVPLAWTMMAYPVLLAARRTTRRWVPLLGGVGMAGWDVFLDPQMVGDRRWTWADPTPALPGVPGVPLTNYAGWLVVGVLMIALLSWLLPQDRADETVPAVLLVWTYVGSVVGNLFWFGTPQVALAGGVAMGLLVLPYLWSLWQSRP